VKVGAMNGDRRPAELVLQILDAVRISHLPDGILTPAAPWIIP
jgi:hypothetical protein